MWMSRVNSAPKRGLGLAAVGLLFVLAAPLVSASSKYACDYSNRLCQWTASYMFGGTVMGDLAFFNGGILSNDASTPVNGSAFEVLDLRTMSPLLIQVEENKDLTTSRYRHHLVVWKDKILAVGGQHDDSNGASQQVINVIELDLNTRQWALRKQFTQPGGQVEIIIEAAVVVDDQLLVVFVTLDPSNASRNFLTLNLNTQKVDFNYNLASGPRQLLDWPLIGIMTLGQDGNFPHLVVQSKRQLPSVNNDVTLWFEVTGQGKYGVEGPLPFNASTSYKKLPGGDGGKVLTMKILRILDKPRLITWAVTTATFPGGRKEPINAVSMYDVDVSGRAGKRSISLQLSKVFLTLPFNISDFSGLQSVDLPLHGNLAVTAADVTALPYIGKVDLIGDLDSSNVNIQEWPDKGFIIRGSSLADYQCQPIATWQPFVLTLDLTATASPAASAGNPAIRAVSNSTWCSTRRQQLNASEIVGDANALATNAKLFTVDSSEGPMLMVLNMKRKPNPGGQLTFPDTQAPLRGAFISIDHSTVHNFSIPAKDYSYNQGYASCVTSLAGSPIYLQTGGQYNDEKTGEQRVDPNFVAVPLQLGKEEQPMLKVGGASSGQGAIFPALACSPDGTVYTFGGLVFDHYENETYAGEDGKAQSYQAPVWAASNRLTAAKLSGSLTAPALSKPQQLGPAAAAKSTSTDRNMPSPRNGHALAYLPAETFSSLGFSKGALLLYGGSNVTDPSLSASLQSEEQTSAVLGNTTFDRSVWLYDLGANKWVKLSPDGLSDAPPGLMYHSIAVQGKQVMLWGGSRFVPQNNTLRISKDLYILDFSQSTPRWRKAPVENINVQGAFQLGFPNTGIAPLPESGVVALMHISGISLTAAPQTLQPSGPAMLTQWGLNTLNLTAGDWIRLEVPTGQGLTVKQPLLLGSDVIITGISTAAAGSARRAAKGGSRGLLQQQQGRVLPVLRCDKNATSAVSIKSSGAVLEGLSITGCNGSAINITVDATGSYTTPATLRNLRIIGNSGSEGAAVNIGPAAAAVLENCTINGNNGTEGSILAQANSQLTIVNSTLYNNHGSAVVFAGSSLSVTGSSFVNNTAALPGALKSANACPAAAAGTCTGAGTSAAGAGGALRIICPDNQATESLSVKGCGSNSTIKNSSFTANAAHNQGGAVYLGSGTFARLEGSNFSRNAAASGGAVLADRDACLYNMTAVRFRDNSASSRGGAVMMRGASCVKNMLWQKAVFNNNTAGEDGGAMYLDEIINRNITGQADFNHNTVTGKPSALMVSSSVPGMGNGGALYLGIWSSNITLYNTTFVNNSAAGSGGAVEVLSIDSNVTLINTTAMGNLAGPTVPNSPQASKVASQAARSEGGAVYFQGSFGLLNLLRVNMTNNTAGRGGAVSVNSELGGFLSMNSSFTNNTALTAGGAVAITERKNVSISNSSFKSNRLRWPGIAAGGGFYCFLCDSVNINSSNFEANVASYGGGAAILQASGPSFVVNSTFVDNTALPSLTLLQEPTQRRRLLAAAAHGQQLFEGQAAANPLALQHVPADILGPIAGNTTGDSGFYTGGGGLYVSVTSRVELNGSCFADNTAYNGGGLVARTDACPGMNATGLPCQLLMSQVSISNHNYAKAAGVGLLVTEINSPWVQLNCSAGNILNNNTISGCLQQPNNLCQSRSRHHSRLLLQSDAAAEPSAAAASSEAASPQHFLATSTASMKCGRMQNSTGNDTFRLGDCHQVVTAAPGLQLDMAVQLYDGLGRPISPGTYDASMPMEVVVLKPDGITQPQVVQVDGNTIQAKNGIGSFPGLKISGTPGNEYQLVFKTNNGVNLTRQLVLRECQAGEHNQTQQNSSPQSSICEACNSPDYSFYPQAHQCGQCALLGRNSYSFCSGAAVVPANGSYQSHPRSPLLTRCITAAACGRSADTENDMKTWADDHANMTITQLNQINSEGQPYYQPYMDMMCSKGYTGPLCGACTEGHGHSAQRCIQCMDRSLNSLCYFLVCLFMFIVPALQTVLHSKNVQKRHQQRGASGIFGSARFERMVSGAKGSVKRGSRRGWPVEMVPEELPQAKNIQLAAVDDAPAVDNDVKVVARLDQSSAVYTLSPYDSGHLSTGADHSVADNVSNSTTSVATAVSPGPFAGLASQPFRHPSGEQQLPVPAVAASAAVVPASLPSGALKSKPTSLLASWFSVEPLNKSDYISHRWSVTAASASSADAPGVGVACKPEDLAAAAAAAATAANGPSGVQVPAKRPKFFHSDVLTMLVSYMQLLGLLRLIRLDWSVWMRTVMATFTYLDFTSGTSTWVSIECSFGGDGLLPKSLKRSLVLMLWPIGALMFLGIMWCAYAYFITRRRGVTRGMRSQLQRLEPYMVLSAVTMLYFLYTPTSREIISLFSCQPVDTLDALQHVAPESSSSPEAKDALKAFTPKNSGWQGVWTSDTSVLCASPVHVGIAIGLGVPGMIVWVFGLPVALWLMLRRDSKVDANGQFKLEDPLVELKYGLMYDKYRYKRYYWECVVLLENCALTMLLVLLQAQSATLQILVAMAVIFIGVILHITFKPYVVKMLDTLRRLAVYTLMATLFLMNLVTLSDYEETSGALPLAALVVIVVINLAVMGIHVWAVFREVRRWILFELDVVDREYLTWGDVRVLVNRVLQVACGGKLQGFVRGISSSVGVGAVQQAQGVPVPRSRNPPKEYVAGTPNGADVV